MNDNMERLNQGQHWCSIKDATIFEKSTNAIKSVLGSTNMIANNFKSNISNDFMNSRVET